MGELLYGPTGQPKRIRADLQDLQCKTDQDVSAACDGYSDE
jgi:hypothetical protein